MNGQLDKKVTNLDQPQIPQSGPHLNLEVKPQPEVEPHSSLYSRLFTRNRPLALDGALADDVLMTDPPSAGPTSVDDVDGTDIDHDGEEAQDVEADTDDED